MGLGWHSWAQGCPAPGLSFPRHSEPTLTRPWQGSGPCSARVWHQQAAHKCTPWLAEPIPGRRSCGGEAQGHPGRSFPGSRHAGTCRLTAQLTHFLPDPGGPGPPAARNPHSRSQGLTQPLPRQAAPGLVTHAQLPPPRPRRALLGELAEAQAQSQSAGRSRPDTWLRRAVPQPDCLADANPPLTRKQCTIRGQSTQSQFQTFGRQKNP